MNVLSRQLSYSAHASRCYCSWPKLKLQALQLPLSREQRHQRNILQVGLKSQLLFEKTIRESFVQKEHEMSASGKAKRDRIIKNIARRMWQWSRDMIARATTVKFFFVERLMAIKIVAAYLLTTTFQPKKSF